MKLLLLLFSFYIFQAELLIAQDDLDPTPVAQAGAFTITKGELLERYEFTPQPGKHKKDQAAGQKLKFLYSLIAEKLWAAEAVNKYLDTSSAFQIAMESIENMLLRDMLWQKEIAEKIHFTDLEMKEALNRFKKKLYVKFLFSFEESEIKELHRRLVVGENFDSLLVTRGEFEEQPNAIEIVYGQMESGIEDSLFKKRKGEFTAPILTPDGWYIFKMENWIEENLRANDEDAINSAKKIFTARKENYLYQKFYSEFFQSKNIDVDAKLLKLLASTLSDVLAEKKYFQKLKDGEQITVDAYDVNNVLGKLSFAEQSSNVMSIEGEEYSLQKIFFRLAFDGIRIFATDIESVFQELNRRMRTFIESELLANEAKRRGYQNMIEVKTDLKMWRDNYLFQLAKNEFTDSIKITESELKEFYNRRHKQISSPPLVNIIEILNDNIDTIAVILNKINASEDFKSLANIYSQREWTKINSGEYGFFPVTQFGEIGRIAATLELNEVYGPIELSEGYSIIKLIGKKEPIVTETKSFEAVREELRQILMTEKIHGLMNMQTATLAEKYGIEIFGDAFNSVQTTEVNSLVIRHLGFGGQMTAVPIVAPFDSWVEIYFRNKNKIP